MQSYASSLCPSSAISNHCRFGQVPGVPVLYYNISPYGVVYYMSYVVDALLLADVTSITIVIGYFPFTATVLKASFLN